MSSEPTAIEPTPSSDGQAAASAAALPARPTVLRSIFFNWASLVVSVVVSIVLTPIMIRSLGQYYYGMWVLVMSIADQYGLLDFGMTSALLRFAGLFQGAKDRSGLNEIFSVAFLLTTLISLGICAFSAAAAGLLPRFFGIAAADRPIFIRLILVLGLTTAIAFPERMLAAYLRGLQRFDLFNAAATGTLLIRAGLFLVALRLGAGVSTIALITLGMGTISFVVHYALVRWADPALRIRYAHLTLPRLRQLFSFSVYSFLASLGTRLITRIDSIVIGRILSVGLIAPFNVASRLTDYFVGVFAGVHGPVLSAMSQLDGAAKRQELQALFLRSSTYTFLLSFFMGTVLLVDGQAFLKLWLASSGLNLDLTYKVLAILTFCYTANQAQLASWTVIVARGRHQLLGGLILCEGLANIGLSVYWGHRYGLLGIALGTTVPAVLHHLLIVPYYALRVIQLPLSVYLRALMRPVLSGAIFWVVCPHVGSCQAESLLLLGSTAVLQSVTFGALCYTIGLPHAERWGIWFDCKRLVLSIRTRHAL